MKKNKLLTWMCFILIVSGIFLLLSPIKRASCVKFDKGTSTATCESNCRAAHCDFKNSADELWCKKIAWKIITNQMLQRLRK